MHGSLALLAALAIFATGLAGGALAMRRSGLDTARPLLLARLGGPAAGGVFLGAGFIHMLGDASGSFAGVFPDFDFPLAFLLASVGFVIVLAIERVVFKAASSAQGPYAYILTLVLGFHSLLAGIALGVEDAALVGLAIAIAIVAHKGAAAFALATSFIKAGMPRPQAWRLIAIFSCITPAGMFIGAMLGNLLADTTGEIVEAVFDSLAAGSFLYIAALDIIQEEFDDRASSHVPAFLSLLAGLALMALIAVWT